MKKLLGMICMLPLVTAGFGEAEGKGVSDSNKQPEIKMEHSAALRLSGPFFSHMVGDLKGFKKELEKGNPNAYEWANKQFGTILMVTTWMGKTDYMEALLETGAFTDAANNFGRPPLVLAATRGHLDAVKLLLKHKANIDATIITFDRDSGYTALHAAARAGHADIVSYLLEQKADAKLKTRFGYTAFELAQHYKRNDVIVALAKHGVTE